MLRAAREGIQCGGDPSLLGVLGTFDLNARLKSLPHASHLRVTSSSPDVADGATDTSFARAPQSGQRRARYAGSVMTRHDVAGSTRAYIFDRDRNNNPRCTALNKVGSNVGYPTFE